jgi:hypothetical protein
VAVAVDQAPVLEVRVGIAAGNDEHQPAHELLEIG